VSDLNGEIAQAESAAQHIRHQLALLAQFAHGDDDSPFISRTGLQLVAARQAQRSLPPRLGYLQGSEIRIAAVRVLAASEAPSRPIRYTDWYEVLVAAGHDVVGQDPLASFLTQIGRSPLVRRAGGRGLYALDFSAQEKIRARLLSLHQELASLHQGQQTIDEVASIAQKRSDLTREVVRFERALREISQSLDGSVNPIMEQEQW